MKTFCQVEKLKNLLDKRTCYKITPIPRVFIWSKKITQKLPKLFHLWNRALQIPQKDRNSTKIIFCVTETKSNKLPQLEILQQYSL